MALYPLNHPARRSSPTKVSCVKTYNVNLKLNQEAEITNQLQNSDAGEKKNFGADAIKLYKSMITNLLN